jgi:predicted ATPase
LYPYNVLSGKFNEPLEFSEVTILYGNNGSGKSTILNILASMLEINGAEQYRWGQRYINRFIEESSLKMAYNEKGYQYKVPENSRYIKSEDLLYEIKKIQQEEALQNGYLYEAYKEGKDVDELREELFDSYGLTPKGKKLFGALQFQQEKYSNGETSLQLFEEFLQPDGIYLLDEPEVSLSLQSQLKVANLINELTRFFHCQFIIATHSPLILSTLRGTIYDFDQPKVRTANWFELGNVKFMYDFFMKHSDKFK